MEVSCYSSSLLVSKAGLRRAKGKKQVRRLSFQTSCRKWHGGRKAEAEQPEAENEGGNDEARVANFLLTTQHLATVLPRLQTNYLHAVGEII